MPPEHVLVLITHAAPRICSVGWVVGSSLFPFGPPGSSWVLLAPLAGFPCLLLALHGSPWICWLSPFGMAPKSSRAWVTRSRWVLLGRPVSSWVFLDPPGPSLPFDFSARARRRQVMMNLQLYCCVGGRAPPPAPPTNPQAELARACDKHN